jgi:two-component system CheB/CheR fusion protein
MARKSVAGRGKKASPQVKNSPAVTPRSKPAPNIELEAAPRPLEPLRQAGPYPIVGVGASAGGLEAFRELLQTLPPDTGLALVLVQHLDPGHESLLAKLLANATAMPVCEVEEGMAVEPNHVYVIPPNKTMGIRNGTLHLIARGQPTTKHLPVDYFLTSLAEDRGNRAVGVILSGTASDGTLGLKAIKAEGGITFAQDSKSAKYDGMPRSAIAAGCVDLVLPPEAIARELARIGRHPYLRTQPPAPSAETTMEGDDDLRRLFVVLQKATGADFRYYKYSTIKRRIARRMLLHKLESLPQYLQFLHENPAEPAALCEDILIHVTGFFREPEAFQALAREIFPKVLDTKAPGESIRVWVPGCSTGEETYSVAMVLLECLGDRVSSVPMQIFGTDISEASIEKARAGVYSESSLAEVSAERLRRFFVKVDGGFQIAKSLREMCVFARQDMAHDPPFSRLDLISCRNVLIYMGPVLHKKVMGTFHYALRSTGFLMLGRSESMSGFTDLFTVVDREHKIWSKRPAELSRRFGPLAIGGYDKAIGTVAINAETQPRFDVQKEADRYVLHQCAPPGLIVNENLQILHFRGNSSPYLSPSPGEASLSLLRMVRPEFAVELRSAIHRAKKQGIAVRKEDIRVQRDGQPWDVCLQVVPLKGDPGERFFLVLFHETPARRSVARSWRSVVGRSSTFPYRPVIIQILGQRKL